MDEKKLLELAARARERSYSPYSGFAVGAALLCADGTVYTGCNIENAAFTPGNCAERTAVFKAVSEGHTRFEAIAVAGGPAADGVSEDEPLCAPCGVCRQVLREFCDPGTMRIILSPLHNTDAYRVFTLDELLPVSFGPEHVKI